MPTVSYVVTIFNKAPYLPFVIEGIKRQEGDFGREFIFVDDGSTDDSMAVLRRLTDGWDSTTIIEIGPQTPAIATNEGIAAVHGDFIKFVDGDDILLPWTTQVLMDAMTKTGCRVAFGRMSREYLADEAGDPEAYVSGLSRRPGDIRRDKRNLVGSLRRSRINPSRTLATSDVVRAAGGCDTNVFAQDYSIELRMATSEHFAFVDEVMCLGPVAAPGRITDNNGQVQHDLNMSLAGLLRDYPELPWRHKWYAHQRAASRALNWARRHGSIGATVRAFLYLAGARCGLVQPTAERIVKTCRIFRETTDVLVPKTG